MTQKNESICFSVWFSVFDCVNVSVFFLSVFLNMWRGQCAHIVFSAKADRSLGVHLSRVSIQPAFINSFSTPSKNVEMCAAH